MLKRVFSRIKNSTFVKNILIVMSGSALAQIIGFALLPVISRLFTPADFGVFGSFNAVASVVIAGATLDYSQALILPKEKNDALHLFFISCISTSLIAVLCIITCLIAPSYLMALVKAPSAWILVLLVFTILISGFNIALQAWCIRIKAFKHTSASQVIRSFTANGIQVGAGFFKTGPIGLIISGVLADLLSGINLLRVFITDIKATPHKISWQRMKQLAKEYHDFPLYSASQDVINALSAGIPVLLLTHYFGIAIAGAYAFGTRILHAPMRLILRALRQVLFQKASETQHKGNSLLAVYVKVTAGLFAVGFLPSAILFIWSPEIFTWIFGTQWQTAGEYARWLVLWMLFVFCNLPAVLFARVIRIQSTVFFYNLVLLAARVAVLVLGGLYLSALLSIIIFSVVGAVMNLLLIILVGYHIMRKEGEISWTNVHSAFMK